MTPEGKVKAAVNRVLARYPESYRFMPVPGGYGVSTLDYLICHYGQFIAIETKAPGKWLTARQKQITMDIAFAGGTIFVIDGVNGTLERLEEYLQEVKLNATHSPDQPKAQDAGRPLRDKRGKPLPRSPRVDVGGIAHLAGASPTDRDIHAEAAGLQRPGSDPDAL